ncbi:MAG: AAA domain-containing protein [Gemmatimonadetes bacterium]|nr:AAA domain-containing protein [Gemmatimonadota bacterium]
MDVRAEKMGLDPEKLRQFLAEQLNAENPPQPDPAGGESGPDVTPSKESFEFDLKPEELEAYLDQYVIRQYQAKAILATKICTHFNRLSLPPDEDEEIIGNIKNNVLMIGPTGVGKTYLIKLIARKLGVPFVKGDATKFSETGYVGGDVEDLVRELVREADGDIERAQYGIIYIDEIDKVASSRNQVGPDVSRSGVQRNLLKLMEETEVDLKAPHDIASQMETVMQMQRTGKIEHKKINTRNILFIVSGAFSGLEEIIAKRLNQGAIGFRFEAGTSAANPQIGKEELFGQVRAEDLIEFGFESEFIGRLPVVAVLHTLSCEDLLAILRNPKSSVILSKKRDFRAYGIDIEFTDEALGLLADRAFEEHTGARGLVGALEKALLNFEKKLPSVTIDRFTVTPDLVTDPDGSLQRLLGETSLESFLGQFSDTHDIKLHISPEAIDLLKEKAKEQETTPGGLCTQLFADYGHGLRLAGQQEFEITAEMIRNPQESLNALIKEFYSSRD